ncbi:MAG: twin-arginine translocase subunit TatA [Cellvibrionaceae bacterium]|nr:twin-arginine translocase subunit TatA [Cellvibrionaceae bacterium]
MGGIGIWQLLIILVIVFMLFGTKRLRGLGGDLGSAIKGFKKAVSEEPAEKVEDKSDTDDTQTVEKVIEGESEKVDSKK